MNINELKPINKLNPFTKFCCTIGNLPSSYLNSMTYYEQLLWFCNFLEKTVIPTLNTNAEAVQELQNLFVELKNYVDNYFTNLDVQEEINNKLDEMAEDGVLESILLNYVNVTKVYNTTVEMLEDTNLKNGMKVKTLGYYEINDGGNANYIISNTENLNIFQETLSNNLFANLINPKNILQFGVKCDGITDCTTQLQNAINYTNILEGTNGTVLISNPILIKKSNNLINIDFKNLNIKVNDDVNLIDEIIKIESDNNYRVRGYLKNLQFDGNGRSKKGLYIQDTLQFSIENIIGKNCIDYEYIIDKNGVTGSATVIANNLRFVNGYEENFENCLNSKAMYIDCPDSHYSNIITLGYLTHIELKSLTFMNKIHSWNYRNTTINNSVMFKIHAQAVLSDVYSDTLQTMFDIDGTGSIDCTNPIFFLNSEFYLTSNNNPTPIIVSEQFINNYGRIRITGGRFGSVSGFTNLNLINYNENSNLRLNLLRISNSYIGVYKCPLNFLDYSSKDLNIDISETSENIYSIDYTNKTFTTLHGFSRFNINATLGQILRKGSYITIGVITDDICIQNQISRVAFIRNNSTNTFYPILARITTNKEIQINVPYEIEIGQVTNFLNISIDVLLNTSNNLYN